MMLLGTSNRQTGVMPGEISAQSESAQAEGPVATDLSYGAVDWFMYVPPTNPPFYPIRPQQGAPRLTTRPN